jgi:hypothetical protein
VVRPALTAPISEEDRRQAVTALSMMIAAWWAEQQNT